MIAITNTRAVPAMVSLGTIEWPLRNRLGAEMAAGLADAAAPCAAAGSLSGVVGCSLIDLQPSGIEHQPSGIELVHQGQVMGCDHNSGA